MSHIKTTTAEEREARELGTEHGKSAGPWAADGNTSDDQLRWLIRAIDDGDPEWEIPAPFSYEWADGLTLGWLSDQLGIDQESDGFDDLVTIFEDAYYQAYERQAYADAKGFLG